ncbi:hypothetical protein PPACK8108_LOCUS26150 [Phakopsora pachyrhizi]|uniref:Secreted protein n=1 Tax=Phakopsora pachyrhizi TaxID=170000 RepID=A0AAV0BYR6_PHAPC|nr:hypothetical protein PPACK8108_LOCUS26150 [Phakopsora pachyrhizi]
MYFSVLIQILLFSSSFVSKVSSHSFMLWLQGEDEIGSTSFGVRLDKRGALVQNTGIILDREILSGQVGECGRRFGGDGLEPEVIVVKKELELAEANGIPKAFPDGSIHMSFYVFNDDGAGPFTCESSSYNGTLDFKPMTIKQQIEGEDGKNSHADQFVYPLIAVFEPNATCGAGSTNDICIIRCRNPIGFGSCAAVRFNSTKSPTINLTDNLNSISTINSTSISTNNFTNNLTNISLNNTASIPANNLTDNLSNNLPGISANISFSNSIN